MSHPAVVYILDDNTRVLEALKRVLVAAGFTVEAYASSDAFFDRVPHHGPACLLLDQCMPERSGLEVMEQLRNEPALPVIFITAYADVGTSVSALKGGAFDFLVKPIEGPELIDTVTRALALSANVGRRQQELDDITHRLARLTARERQVCELVARGLLNKQIAAELGASEKTIKIHRARVMQKLGVGSAAELARLMERIGRGTERRMST